ncbi:MAG: iron-containing alcohol dehydrogenase [Lachnospiraceae bacterium]|nr:iron-containing alcohol dehydrogenase [Lachnospiraceae bacterium]
MNNFIYHAPTKIIFGKDTVKEAGEEAKRIGTGRVLIVYGSERIRQSGLLGEVEESLDKAGIAHDAFGGVKANPTLAHAEEGIKKAIDFEANLILAVGGGSVIDTAKGIAHGAANPDKALWDIWTRKVPLDRSIKIAAILTIPAAGSEMSDSAVLTNEAAGKKLGINTEFNRCAFAIMDPDLAESLPDWQLKNGIVDIMMHTLERYFISDIKCDLTDSIAEGVIRTVRDNGRIALRDRSDYDAMAEIWWASSVSHNNLTELGRGKDFSVHKIGMALSAKYDYTHGATLSAVWASWARYLYKGAIGRFARYARNVWGIDTADDEQAAILGINATESFFREIGMPVSLRELGLDAPTDEEIHALALHATMDDTVKLSRIRPLDVSDIEKIYRMAV